MATYLLTDRQVEIVNEVFANSVLRERAARVDDFRIDHVDWIDDLSRLSENKSILIEDEVYRVSILFLPDVDHVGAAKQLEQCATVLEALRERYLDKSTRYVAYRLVDLSRELGLSYDTAVTAIQYLLDIGFLWMAGLNTSNLNDRESAGIFAGESIIRLKKLPDFLEYARELRQSSGSIGLRVPVPDPLESKEDEGAEVALRPERVISAYLGKLNSDEFVEITSLAGLEYDLGLTTKESFSKITRLRAYIPRLNEALSSLPDRQRLAAVNIMCKGLLKILPAERESVENSLTSIGWRLGPDNSIITDSEKLAEAFFPQGSVHDAYQHIRSICGSATRSLLVVDGYADSSFFTMILAVVLESASIQLLTGPKVPADLILEASMFCHQHPVRKVEIKQRADFHDRFVIVDDRECYHVGASIKDAGKKAFMISRIEDGENIALLLAQYRSSWTAARSIFPP